MLAISFSFYFSRLTEYVLFNYLFRCGFIGAVLGLVIINIVCILLTGYLVYRLCSRGIFR